MIEIGEETIQSIMKEKRKFTPPKTFSRDSHIKSIGDYNRLYKESIEDPDKFWSSIAEELHWFKRWDKIHSWDKISWIADGLKLER